MKTKLLFLCRALANPTAEALQTTGWAPHLEEVCKPFFWSIYSWLACRGKVNIDLPQAWSSKVHLCNWPGWSHQSCQRPQMTIHQGTAANPGFSSHIGFGKQQDCRGRKEAVGCFSDPGSDANQGPCCGLHWEEGPNSIPTNISLSIKLPGNSMGQDQAPLDLQPIMENHHHLSTRKRAKCATLMETRLRRPGG